jgi:hypothetical protein
METDPASKMLCLKKLKTTDRQIQVFDSLELREMD